MDLKYAAGFFDGEGCVNFCRNKGGSLFLRVMVVNTNLPILEEFKKSFGGSIQALYRAKPNWKPAYTWKIANNNAAIFLSKIEPYLQVKQKQVTLAFCFGAIKPGSGKTQDEATIQLLEDQMHWLNQRGIQAHPEPIGIVLNES